MLCCDKSDKLDATITSDRPYLDARHVVLRPVQGHVRAGDVLHDGLVTSSAAAALSASTAPTAVCAAKSMGIGPAASFTAAAPVPFPPGDLVCNNKLHGRPRGHVQDDDAGEVLGGGPAASSAVRRPPLTLTLPATTSAACSDTPDPL